LTDSARTAGDPHIKTVDGKEYTFNGWGEYCLSKLNFNGTAFDLQVKMLYSVFSLLFFFFIIIINLVGNIGKESNLEQAGNLEHPLPCKV
jgi:hypothetical protein